VILFFLRKKEMDKNKDVLDFAKKSDYRKAKERAVGEVMRSVGSRRLE
jgi:hypothetical protein